VPRARSQKNKRPAEGGGGSLEGGVLRYVVLLM
jgi:hypothetical protein